MSEEHLQDSRDGKPVLQKQYGCMTAIFRMFESRHVRPSKWVGCHHRQRLPSGHSRLNDGNRREQAITSPKKAKEKSLSKSQNDQSTSTGASFSSSTCCSYPSLPIDRATPLECSIINSRKTNNSDVNCESTSHAQSPSCHSQSARDSVEFGDVAKDSIYGGQLSSVKNNNREELANHVLMHKDFFKPLKLSKSRDGTSMVGIGRKPRMSMGNESPRIQEKFAKASCYHGNARESPRSSCEVKSASLFSASLDTRRFSYDGQDLPRKSSVSRETCRSPMKLRELPRLSLDSRECCMRSSNFNSKTSTILEDLKDSSIELKVSNNCERYPSVVAKLMGLEAMPNSRSSVNVQMGQMESQTDEALDLSDDEFSRKMKESKHHQSSRSQTSSFKGHVSPQQRNSEVVKPILSPRFQIETATSSQQDRSCGPRRTAFRIQDSHADEALDVFDGELSRNIRASNQNQSSGSPRSSLSAPISPQRRNSEVMKPLFSSRLQHEIAPLRQQDSGEIETTFVPTNPLSVYGEMERRIKELEFKKSSKDLRALKHILKATQVKEIEGTKKEAASYNVSNKNYNDSQNQNKFDQNPNSENRPTSQNSRLISSPTRRTNKGNDVRPPNVIRRPELIDKSSIPTSSVMPFNRPPYPIKLRIAGSVLGNNVSLDNQTCKGPIPKLGVRESANRILRLVDKKTKVRNEAYGLQKPCSRSMQDSSRPQTSTRENVGSLTGSSGSSSPRMQQRKIELEKRCRLPTCSSVLSKSCRQAIVQPVELGSPGRKQRIKSDHLRKNGGQSSELRSEARNLSCEVDVISIQSHCYNSMGADRDMQIIGADKFQEMRRTSIQYGCQSPRRTVVNDTVLSSEHKKSMWSYSKDCSSMDFTTVASEQPSPVSVLDVLFYEDGLLPSPVKRISRSTQGDEEWSPKGTDYFSNNMRSSFISRNNDKKLELQMMRPAQKPRQLKLDSFGSTSVLDSLCEDTNPDHRYISEILLASSLLDKDRNSSSVSTQLHLSGYVINPNMFMALEKMKARCLPIAGSTRTNLLRSKLKKEKLHRKLMFDTVNEILLQRLEAEAEPWLQVNKLAGLIPTRRRLVRELCMEIDWLQAGKSNNLMIGNDAMPGLQRWVDFRKESSCVVLDIERLIFKDMIDEIIRHLACNSSKSICLLSNCHFLQGK